MKHVYQSCLILFSCCLYNSVCGQGDLYIHNATLSVKSNLYVQGSLKFDCEDPIEDMIDNTGNIFIGDSLINLSPGHVFVSKDPETGLITFNGAEDQHIVGDSAIFFRKIRIDKPSGQLTLNDSVRVSDTLSIARGKIFLNGKQIFLSKFYNAEGYYGLIIGENESNAIYDAIDGTGTIKFSMPHGDRFTANYGYLGLNLATGIQEYPFEIVRGHGKQGGRETGAGPGDGSIDRYYDLGVPAGINADSVSISYFDNEISDPTYDEGDFSLWVSQDEGSHWLNMWNQGTSSRNISDNTITAFHNEVFAARQRFTIAPGACVNPPKINFAKDTVVLCEGDTALLDPQIEGLNYLWYSKTKPELGDKQTLEVSENGWYYLVIRDARGCVATDSVLVELKPNPVAKFKLLSNELCTGSLVEFVNETTVADNDTSGVSYKWHFKDPDNASAQSSRKNPAHTYGSYGTFYPVLSATTRHGCVDTDTLGIVVNEIPAAEFSIAGACVDQPLEISNLSSSSYTERNINYHWTFDDDSDLIFADSIPEKFFSSPGVYNATLIVFPSGINYCADTAIHAVEIFPKPELDISLAGEVCENNDIAIVNNSTIVSGTMTFQWDFGDGQTSTLNAPEKSYSEAGAYQIKASASSGKGCVVSDSFAVQVIGIPEVKFSATQNICLGSATQFDIQSPTNPSYDYLWDFGNGQTSTSSSTVSIAYSEARSYHVMLSVSNELGCVSTATQEVRVSPLPEADFTFTNACSGKNINLINQSKIASGRMDYLWHFGDLTSSSHQNPSKTYQQAGDYPITLEVASQYGCTDSIEKIVTIYENPTLDFGEETETCGGSLMLDAQNPGSNYQWSTGQTSQEITVTKSGSYWVKVENAYGCEITENVDVRLYTPLNPDLGGEQAFCGSGQLDAGYPGATYLWSDRSTSRYLAIENPGAYTFGVEITDQNNCKGYDTVNVVVHDLPRVDLGGDLKICHNGILTLDAGGDGDAYEWSTGAETQTIEVASTGVYGVTVTNEAGCRMSDEVVIRLNEQPVINLPDNLTACSEAILDAGEGFSSYSWSTGSRSRSVTVEQSQEITLRVGNQFGCIAEKEVYVEINPVPYFSLGSDQNVCHGQTVYLTPNVVNDGYSYEWSDGNPSSSILVSESGLYALTATTDKGCSFTDEAEVAVYPPLIVDFPAEKVICTDQYAHLSAGASASHYAWFFDGVELVEHRDKSNITLSDAGTYRVMVSDEIGCTATDSVRIYETTNFIEANFLVKSLANVGDTLEFVQLTAPEPTWYHWDFGDGSTSKKHSPLYSYFIPGAFNVTLIASNDICVDTLSKEVVIQNLKEAEAENESDSTFSDLLVEITHFRFYPNPAKESLTLEIEITQPTDVTVVVYSLSGVEMKQLRLSGSDIREEIDLDRLPAGLYLMKVVVGELKVFSERLIKIQ